MDGKVIYRYNIAKVLFKVSQKASLSLISTSTFREANCFKKVLHLKKKKKKDYWQPVETFSLYSNRFSCKPCRYF